MKVPLLDLAIHHAPLQAEIMAAIAGVAASNHFIMGPAVTALERDVAAYCRVGHAVAVSSGTDALLVALMALNIGPGDEVITSPYSFFATAGVVARLGARPVLVDIDPATFNLNPAALAAACTPRTRAVIPVHLYGQCADMEPILALCRARGVAVVEDAAQAIGAEYRDGRRAGTLGELGCLSFFPTKNLGAWGDAGMVLTNSDALAQRLRILRVHGSEPKYYHQIIGGNFRIDTLQAAVLNVKLPHLDTWTLQRQHNADRYDRLFHATSLVSGAQVVLPAAVYRSAGVAHYHIYNQYVLRVPRRDELRAFLTAQGVGTEIYYPVPFHLQECFKYLGYAAGAFPEAERAARETVALPIYPELTEAQQTCVVQQIAAFYAR